MAEAFPNIPNFDVLTRLGAGGMGRVYLAKHRGAYGFEKLLAVKVIHPERGQHEGLRAMFLDEARLVAQLHHPAIAQVYDFGESEGALYLVMEYVSGVSLSELLVEGRRLPPLICASIVAAVCRGLHAAHEAKDVQGRALNVVHRDVTPSNLVLTFGGQMKILDFGIALMRHRSAPITSAGQIRGKPTYYSPEQIEGEPIDRRTDIYSLAIVMHEILTGQKLFSLDEFLGRPAAPRNWKELAGRVQAPSASIGPLPGGLDQIVMRGLAVEPSARYQDARAMAVDLEAIIEREGCETLESFVERQFERKREIHEAQMRSILGGTPLLAPIEQHPGTLDDVDPPPVPEVPTQPGELERPDPATTIAPPPPPPAPRSITTPLPIAPPPKKRRGALIAALLAIGVGTVLFLALGSEPEAVKPEGPPQSAEKIAEKMAKKIVEPTPIAPPPPLAPPPVLQPPPPKVSERPTDRVRKAKPKKPATTKKTGKKVSKPVPSDGIIEEW
jgi:eukaryotic-like serine/threonine-protein kinase